MKRGNEQVVEKSIEYLVPETNLVYENYYWYAIIWFIWITKLRLNWIVMILFLEIIVAIALLEYLKYLEYFDAIKLIFEDKYTQ